MDTKEATDTVKWALQRMDWYKLERLTQALEALGPVAISVLRQLAREKHERAKNR